MDRNVCADEWHTGRVDGLNSNLNLNEGSSPRVMPGLGDWGPRHVPGTRAKKRWRWITIIAFVVVLALVVAYGYWVYTMIS